MLSVVLISKNTTDSLNDILQKNIKWKWKKKVLQKILIEDENKIRRNSSEKVKLKWKEIIKNSSEKNT